MKKLLLVVFFLSLTQLVWANDVVSRVVMKMKNLDKNKATELMIEEYAHRLIIKNSIDSQAGHIQAEKTYDKGKDKDYVKQYRDIWVKLEELDVWSLKNDPKPDSQEGVFEINFIFKNKKHSHEITVYVTRDGVDAVQPVIEKVGRLFEPSYRYVTDLYTELMSD